MARLNILTVKQINALTAPGDYGDGGGLYLQVKPSARRSWLFRFKIAGKTRWMGLGAYPDVGLAEAREAAAKARALTRNPDGAIDPIEAKREAVVAKAAAAAEAKAAAKVALRTFRAAAMAYIAAHEAGWKNPKHAAQWPSTLATYVYPVMGELAVEAVDTDHVLAVLEPIWRVKAETAARVRGRIELVLDYAKARGCRSW